MLSKGSEFLLGLFYSDEETLVYDKIKLSYNLPEESIRELKSISFKFLGPLLMTRALYKQQQWRIDYIETSLTPQSSMVIDDTLMQSFICLNSSLKTAQYITNLFAFIGSPYTEDLALIYERLDKYIHPSIIQGKFVAQKVHGPDFDFNTLINEEMKRGIDLLEHTLGSPRKIYWEEKTIYTPIAVIKRTLKDGRLNSDLYTFDLEDPLRKEALNQIPSYYFLGILPDYYEKRMNKTLRLFGKDGLYSNINKMKISSPNKVVLYVEEFATRVNEKISYGLILIPDKDNIQESRDLFFYKKKLRNMLDKNNNFERSVIELNSSLNPFDGWNLNSEESLQKIEKSLDKKQ
ncbi:MAG: hypothetical protein ACFFBY_13195 [Promethearchaeota archaeon]